MTQDFMDYTPFVILAQRQLLYGLRRNMQFKPHPNYQFSFRRGEFEVTA